MRNDLPRGERIHLLLDDHTRKGLHHGSRSLATGLPRTTSIRRGSRASAISLEAGYALRDVGVFATGVAGGDHLCVAAMRVDAQLALLVGAPQAESDEEHMQQTGVVS